MYTTGFRGYAAAALAVSAGLVVGGLTASASAEFVGAALTVQATNANGQSGPVDILAADGSTLLGTLADSSLFYQQDPQVSLGFEVISGATDTIFTVQSTFFDL